MEFVYDRSILRIRAKDPNNNNFGLLKSNKYLDNENPQEF
jgi:hypothetical protein